MQVGILGASGFVGGELLRLLLLHPNTEVTIATSRQYERDYVHRIHANLRGFTDLQFSSPDIDQILKQCEFVFTAVPHGSALKVMPTLVNSGIKVVDMSADYRLRNAKDYEKWYGYTHPHPDLLEKFTLGIPELRKNEIKNSDQVSAPGCMAVTSILGLAPLAHSGIVEKRAIIDAKVGSSGAGTKPSLATLHAERYGVIRPYQPVGHRHTAEIEQELSAYSPEFEISLSAHAVNIVRGILCTSYLTLNRDYSVQDIWKVFRSFYDGQPFIRFIRDRKGVYRYPDPKILVGSNFCDIGFDVDRDRRHLVVLSATDNLVKGAAGIAIQSMNLMMNYEETMGLMLPPIHPV